MKILLTADWHLREDKPVCRLDDDWMASQKKDLEIIKEICMANFVDQVWILGDIFHTPTVPAQVVNLAIDGLHEISRHVAGIKMIAGNHDLPYHNVNLMDRCSYGTIKRLYNMPIEGALFGINATGYDFGTEKDTISDTLCIHRLVFPSSDKQMAEMAGGQTTKDIAKEFPKANRVFMGDYHKGYIDTFDGKTFVMPGCMNVQSGGLADYRTMVVLWDTYEDTFEPIYIDNPLAKITTDHLVEAKERDTRLEACLDIAGSSLKKEFDFPGELKAIAYNLKVEDLATEMLTELNVGG